MLIYCNPFKRRKETTYRQSTQFKQTEVETMEKKSATMQTLVAAAVRDTLVVLPVANAKP